MAIKFRCPNPVCGKALRVKDELAGREGACPACGAPVRIPTNSDPVAPEDPEEPVESAAPLRRLSSVQAATAQPAQPQANGPAVRPILYGGMAALALYLVSIFLPWQTATLSGEGLFGGGTQASRAILGITCAPAVVALVVSLAALAFLVWTWLQRRDLLQLAIRIAAVAAILAFVLALGQLLRGGTLAATDGFAFALKIRAQVHATFGIYLALISSFVAVLAFGAVGFVFPAALSRELEPNSTAARPAKAATDTPNTKYRTMPIGAWVAVGSAIAVIAIGGGIAFWLMSPRVQLENLPKVRSGMTLAEVEGLLGPGEVVATQTIPASFNPFGKKGTSSESKTIRWRAEKDGVEQEVSLAFIDGKVMTGFGGGDDAPPTATASGDVNPFGAMAKALTDSANTQGKVPPPVAGDAPQPKPQSRDQIGQAPPARMENPLSRSNGGGMRGAITDLDGALAGLKRGGFDQIRALDWLISAPPVDDRRADVTTALAALLDGPAAPDRPKVATALAAWASPAQLALLIRALDDPDEGVRRVSIGALGKLKDPQAAAPLAKRLSVPSDRGAAARALIALGAEVAPVVQPFLQSDDRAVRTEAANVLRAIGALGSDGGVIVALADLKDRDNGVRVRALKDLARAQPGPTDPRRTETATTLAGLLNDPEGSIRVEAARALAAWAIPENVPVLLDLLGSDSGDLRRAAMEALGRLGDKRAVPLIARRLIDGGDRSQATRALQALGPIAEAETLRYLQHRDAAVRAAACRVLQMAGTRKSVQPLRYIANNDRNRETAQAALNALDGISRRKNAK